MKILVLLFVIGCASAFGPGKFHSLYDDIVLDEAVDQLLSDVIKDAPVEMIYRRNDETSEYAKKIRRDYERVLEQVRDMISWGKIAKDELFQQLKELKQKLKDLNVDIGGRAREIYNEIKEKTKDYIRKLLNKLGLKHDKTEKGDFNLVVNELARRANSNENSEYAKKIQRDYERVLEQIKDMISWGKIAKDELFDQLKELRQKLRALKVDIGDRAREIYKQLKEKTKDYIRNLLSKLGLKHDKVSNDLDLKLEDDDLVQHADKSEYAKKIREDYERVLGQIRDMISWGRIAKDELFEQLKELRKKLRDLNVDVGDRAREIYNEIKEKTKNYIKNFLDTLGLTHKKVSRAVDLEFEVDELVRRVERNGVSEIIMDAFSRLLQKIEENMKQGHPISKELIERLQLMIKKLKEMNIDIDGKAREMYDKMMEKAKDYVKNLLDKLGRDDKSVARMDINIRNVFKKLKDAILKKIDKQALKDKIEQLFGRGNELADQMLELLKTKGEQGKKKLLELINRILDDKEETRQTRSLQDLYEKVRDYFKKLNIELKERYVKFGQWVKDTVKKGVDASKSRLENIKTIAKEFVEKAKLTEKDIAAEALEFFRVYKEDLGNLWDDLKESVKEVLKRED